MKTIIAAAITVAFALPVRAQPTGGNCAPRGAMVAGLAGKFGETRQSIGLAADGTIVEVFASAETGTWTITVTRPSGIACMVAAGSDYAVVSEAPPPEGDPT